MMLKLLKLNAKLEISSGATETSSSGSFTRRNTAQGLAPSTVAASVSSSGMDCSAPVQMRNMYGNPSHRFTSSTLTFASHGSVSHGMSAPKKSTWLTNPKSWLSSPDHTSAERNPGNAYGSTMITR